MNENVWTDIVEQLQQHSTRPIKTLELPGYGDAENVVAHHTAESLCDWLAGQITEPSTVIGWSLGGLVALKLAIKFPEKVLQLGLVTSSPKFMADETWPGIDAKVLKGFSKQLKADHRAVIERFMAIQAMGSASAKQDIKRIKTAVLAKSMPTVSVLDQGLAILKETDLRQEISKMAMPVHVLLGKLDALVPIKMESQLPEFTSSFNVTVVDKASHAPFISHPEAFQTWCLELIGLT